MDIENLHKKVNDENIKNELCAGFQNIKEKHLQEKEKSKHNVYEEVQKMMYDKRRETSEVIPINLQEFKTQCDNDVRRRRIELVNKNLKHMEGEPLMIYCLKGHLLLQHKKAIGVKNFYDFCKDTGENHDYALFLIRFNKLLLKYKKLQCCRLPIRFFRYKFTLVKEVCVNNPKDWE